VVLKKVLKIKPLASNRLAVAHAGTGLAQEDILIIFS
jgi:hypothetical protein